MNFKNSIVEITDIKAVFLDDVSIRSNLCLNMKKVDKSDGTRQYQTRKEWRHDVRSSATSSCNTLWSGQCESENCSLCGVTWSLCRFSRRFCQLTAVRWPHALYGSVSSLNYSALALHIPITKSLRYVPTKTFELRFSWWYNGPSLSQLADLILKEGEEEDVLLTKS